jgi:hypothetical protein
MHGDPVKPSLNLRPLLAYSPWLIVLAGFGWFFNRRAKLKRLRGATLNQPGNEMAR